MENFSINFKGVDANFKRKNEVAPKNPTNKNIENRKEVCSKTTAEAIKGYTAIMPACELKYQNLSREEILTLLKKNGIKTDILLDKKGERTLKKDFSQKELARYAFLTVDIGTHQDFSSLFAQFDDKKFNQVKKLLASGINAQTAYFNLGSTNLSDENFENAVKIIEAGEGNTLWAGFFAEKGLDENHLNRAIELAKRRCNDFNVHFYMDMDDNTYEKAINLMNKGATDAHANVTTMIDDTQYARILTLCDMGQEADSLLVAFRPDNGVDDKQYERLLELSEKSSQTNSIIEISKLDNKEYKEAKALMDEGFEANDALIITCNNFSDKEKEKIKTSVKNGAKVADAALFIKKGLSEQEYQNGEEFSKRGVNTEFSIALAKKNETRCKKALSLLDEGQDPYTVRNISELKDEKYATAVKFMDKGYIPKDALGLAQCEFGECDIEKITEENLTPEYFKKLHEIHSYLIKYDRCLKLAPYTDNPVDYLGFCFMPEKNFERAMRALEKGAKPLWASLIGNADEPVYGKIKNLTEGGLKVPQNESVKIAELEGDNYDKAIKLLEQGVSTNVPKIAQMDNSISKRIIELVKSGIEPDEAIKTADFGEGELEDYKTLIGKGFSPQIADEIVRAKDTINREEIDEIISSGIRPDIAYVIHYAGENYDAYEPYTVLAEAFEAEGVEKETIETIFDKVGDNFPVLERILRLYEFGNENLNAMFDIAQDEEKFLKWLDSATKTNEKINKIKERILPESELSKYDLWFLRKTMFKNPNFTPEEYLSAFNFFKNLSGQNGEKLLNSSTFLEKIHPKNEDLTKDKLGILYHNIEELLKLNPASVEASYVEMFLELMQKGVIHNSAIRTLASGNNGQEGANLKADFEISNNVKNDIDKLYEVIIKNKDKKNLENEVKEAFAPSFKDESKALGALDTGDVCQIEGEKFIKIKTGEGKILPLNFSKETYLRLFPPVDRFATCQQAFGDCYCIEPLLAIYSNPNIRHTMLSTIFEDKNGDITIQTPNSYPVKFEKGKLPKGEQENAYSSGAPAYKLFEYVVGTEKVQDNIKYAKCAIPDEKKQEFEDFIAKNGENIFIYEENGEKKWTTFDEAMYRNFNVNKHNNNTKYANYMEYVLGNGGHEIEIYNKFGLDSGCTLYVDEDNIKAINELLEKITPEFCKENIVSLGLAKHSYSLNCDLENGKKVYKLFNPHSQAIPLRLESLEEIKKELESVTTAKLKKG